MQRASIQRYLIPNLFVMYMDSRALSVVSVVVYLLGVHVCWSWTTGDYNESPCILAPASRKCNVATSLCLIIFRDLQKGLTNITSLANIQNTRREGV